MDEHDSTEEVGELYVSDTRFQQLRDGKSQSEKLTANIENLTTKTRRTRRNTKKNKNP
jgi:hypothetical protein